MTSIDFLALRLPESSGRRIPIRNVNKIDSFFLFFFFTGFSEACMRAFLKVCLLNFIFGQLYLGSCHGDECVVMVSGKKEI